MYIYQSGMIGEAVHAKIADAKASIMSGTKSTQTFGDLLRSLMTDTNEAPKAVGAANNSDSTSPIARTDGRTLLYALTNADNDTTASAVVGALGLPISDSGVKAAADGLVSSINVLTAAADGEKEAVIPVLTDFTDKYNELITDLGAQSTTSGIMYNRLFRAAANTSADELAKAGISVGDDGKLTLDPGKYESAGLERFLSSIMTAANAVSTYASSITGTANSSLLDFLGNDEENTTSTSNYYSSLINSMM